MIIHVVSLGETVYSIAEQYGVDPESIEYVNQLQYPYILVVGQALLILTGEQNRERRGVYVNGYAYPFISRWTLNATLPYLTYLSIFSYGFTPEGEIIHPALDDSFMINAANLYGRASVLTLTPFGIDGRFNNNLISALVNDITAQQNLIARLIVVMEQKGFSAIDIDFEYILADDRDEFTAFVERMRISMEEKGYETFVALAPKTSATQTGLLYEGKDYYALGQVATAVLIMTYEWGYAYGPPMAVAPVNLVRNVVEYAVSEIPSEKISLGIPNYGYDWTLPYVRGGNRARTIGNIEAIQLALNNGASISFDEVAKSPYFYYTSGGTEHVVWFEDVRSLDAKFNLVNEYDLRGMGYWTIMQWFNANWQLLEGRFEVINVK